MPPKVEKDPLILEKNIAIKRRSFLRTKITKQLNYISQTFNTLNNATKLTLIDKLKCFQTELNYCKKNEYFYVLRMYYDIQIP